MIDAPPADSAYARMPPTLQRWAVLDCLIEERSNNVQALLVRCDTMIRWDAPDIFALARGFSAVADVGTPAWALRSITAFQHLFPEVALPWWEYFNSGFIVLGAAQRPFIRAFLDDATTRWAELEAVMTSGNVGTEQTPLNFTVRRENEPVHFLPRPFNFVNCFPLPTSLPRSSTGHSVKPSELASRSRAVCSESVRAPIGLQVCRTRLCLALHERGDVPSAGHGGDLATRAKPLSRRGCAGALARLRSTFAGARSCCL